MKAHTTCDNIHLQSFNPQLSASRPEAIRRRGGVMAAILLALPALANADQDAGRRDFPAPGNCALDVQVNDPALDHELVEAAGAMENVSQNSATLAADGEHIVVGYSSSANTHWTYANGVFNYAGPAYFSAYSVSHDRGKSWKSGFIPAANSSAGTAGGGNIATDRSGNFYYSSGTFNVPSMAVTVSKSTDHGDTFGPATEVSVDNVATTPWLAVGPDPAQHSQDNLYLTWSTASATAWSLSFSRSTDGGATWSPATVIFTPADNGVLSSYVQYSTPVVDRVTGRLYVPFLNWGDLGTDFIRVLVSDDGGATFQSLAFNVSGAPNNLVYPIASPGLLADLGSAGYQTVVKQGLDIGGGIWNLPRYVKCSATYEQPTAAASHGRFVLAVNTSLSPTWGDSGAGSRIVALYSSNGGQDWEAPVVVAESTSEEPQHFHPALAMSHDAESVYVGYYVQQADEQVRTDLAVASLHDHSLHVDQMLHLSSVAFDLPPSNVPEPANINYTRNFDRAFVPGVALGGYMGVATDREGGAIAAWGDARNPWLSPPVGMYPGLHAQTDVFFRHIQ